MQKILAGKSIAEKILVNLRSIVSEAARNFTLAIVLVGDDPGSHIYKDRLVKLAAGIGIKTNIHILKGNASTEDLLAVINRLNSDKEIDGILPMMPLPLKINNSLIKNALSPIKDVDCLSSANAGPVYLGESPWAPCTARAVMEILNHYDIPIAGKHAVIIGRSNVIGKPLVPLLLAKDATVTVCHSKTVDLPQLSRQADILVAAVGCAGFVNAAMVKNDVVLIDVGINQVNGQILGDIDKKAISKASAYTPVPGGVGAVSTVLIMQAMLRNY